jgi:hypothetical protein
MLIVSDEAKSRPLLNPATHIAIAIGLVITAMTSAGFLAKYGLIPWTTLIFIAGTVGGVVNSFRRIQKLSLGQIRKQNPMARPLVTIQIYVSPFVGGVFAIILYLIFMSGLIKGSLFPAFQSADEPFSTFRGFAALTMPETHADMAKAIVWGFIAGFSEGLVPNFISKIARETSQGVDAQESGPGESSGTVKRTPASGGHASARDPSISPAR